MQHTQFRQYDLEEQLVMTMTYGSLLLEYKRYNMMLRLFAYQDFYVQVTSNNDSNEVLDITAFEDVDCLDHLLSTIDISDIFSRS